MADLSKEQIIEQVLQLMVEFDALRGLLLAMLDANKDKDSILAAFSEQSHGMGDFLLDSQLSDDFLERHQKACEELLALVSRPAKPL